MPNPEAAQFYVIGEPRSLDARIRNYQFKAEWWGLVPPQTWSNEPHAHVDLEISCVTEGAGVMRMLGRDLPLEKGQVLISLPGDEHRLRSGRGKAMGLSFVAFEVRLEASVAGDAGQAAGLNRLMRAFLSCPDRIRRDGPEGDIGALFGMIGRAMEGRFLGWRASAAAASHALILNVARLFAPLAGILPETPEEGAWRWLNWSGKIPRDDALVDRVNDYVIRHCRQNLKIEDVARALGVNVRKLQRRMERHGYSFRALLHGVRMEMAKYLLMVSDLSAEEVARQVGLARLSYFSGMFRKKFGVSPMRFRAMREGPLPGRGT